MKEAHYKTHRPESDAYRGLGGVLGPIYEPSGYLTKGFTVSDRVWVTIDIVCVWDIHGVVFFKT